MSRRGENIRKRKDGRWEGRYIKGYDSKKQKARYASVYGKTYAETKQKLDEAKYKSSIGVVYVDAKNKLFGEIINSWFNAKKINLKPSSIIKYQNLIEKHILPELGHRKLRELNADLFYTFLDAQQKNGNKKNGGMLSTSSLQTMLYILNATIKYAASNNMVAYFSICLTRSGKEATPIQTLEQHEEDALDLFLSTHISRRNLGIMLSLYCGLRIGEVCALQWTDIDTKNAILYVRRTVQRIAHSSGKTKTKIHVGSPKSKSSIRVIPIPSFLVPIICTLAQEDPPDAYILTGSINKPLEPRTFQYYFDQVLTMAGIQKTNYHTLRHTFATREMWPVGQVEYDEIKKFHIPIFSVNGNSTDLMGPDGKIVLKNYFYISPYNYVSETIELLDDQLIDIQIRYLLDVINVHNVQKKNSYNWQISYFDIKRKWMSINNKSSLFEYCNNLLASIQSAVSNCTLNEELELYFAPVKDSRTGRYSMDIMKDALYSGRYGVQIFLEMYYHFYGFEQRKKALENRVLKMANDFYLNTNEMKWFNLSFTNGVASLLMELRNFALISNRNSFVEMIFKIIKSIPEKNITRSEESDYYNGIAGLLYIICDCYKKFNVDIDLYARNLIEYIVTDLFKRCDICGLWFQEEFYHQPLTGLAHGQSGYALALSKALPYINEGMRLKVTSQIQKCMDYEYNCYDNSEMNLPDYRKLLLKKGGDKSQKKFMYGYCSGILGTALVVSELSEELISFQKKEIWKMNAVQYLKKDILIGNDSLCCGTAGWIDYLASCHKNEEWSDELLKKIIFSINEQGYVFNGLEGVNEISLFKGMSGIGYSVLRYMGKYPSVLL